MREFYQAGVPKNFILSKVVWYEYYKFFVVFNNSFKNRSYVITINYIPRNGLKIQQHNKRSNTVIK